VFDIFDFLRLLSLCSNISRLSISFWGTSQIIVLSYHNCWSSSGGDTVIRNNATSVTSSAVVFDF